MDLITGTSLWRRTLANQGKPDPHSELREQLRNALTQFRSQASVLADNIQKYLSDLTVHDITHIDPLWQIADILCGPDYPFTPPEAFVLGGAFLLHDLGLALASYRLGLEELKQTKEWEIVAVRLLRQRLGRAPQREELEHLESIIEQEVIQQTLRDRHAKQAEGLGTVGFSDLKSEEQHYLIENSELRTRYGLLMGRIAYSHWWGVDNLYTEFSTTIGAPPGCPADWQIDPLKLACVLRVADACHLDERRAPRFLRVIRRPSGSSAPHWTFQEYLQTPRVNNCRVEFTATRPFPRDEAEAWWLCHDALRNVDSELGHVDSLLRDKKRQPLLAHGVAGIGTVDSLTRFVRTEGWSPVDARVRITDAAKLIRRLGGEGLYGQDPVVPLRELIQNAADALRARRVQEHREDSSDRIVVRVGRDERGDWLEVEDCGIGMSEELLTGPFLDFGTTYWGSELMAREHPRLLLSTFESTGKYGIGFFSVFMWGQQVRVTTRRQEDGIADTRVLEFGERGLESRPILRKAQAKERLRGPGTCVRVWVVERCPHGQGCPRLEHQWNWLLGRLTQFEPFRDLSPIESLRAVCARLCPTLDVDLYVEVPDEQPLRAIEANDWMTLDSFDLLLRATPLLESYHESWTPQFLKEVAPHLRTIKNSDQQVVGRACLKPPGGSISGVVTAGGFRANPTTLVLGVFLGKTASVVRKSARPVVEPEALAEWATEQAGLAREYAGKSRIPTHYAQIVRSVGGDTGELAIARGQGGLLSSLEIAAMSDLGEEIFLVNDTDWSQYVKDRPDLTPLPNVFVVSNSAMGNMREICAHDFRDRAEPWFPKFRWNTPAGATAEAICRAWHVSLKEALGCSEFYDTREAPAVPIAQDSHGTHESQILGVLRRPR